MQPTSSSSRQEFQMYLRESVQKSFENRNKALEGVKKYIKELKELL